MTACTECQPPTDQLPTWWGSWQCQHGTTWFQVYSGTVVDRLTVEAGRHMLRKLFRALEQGGDADPELRDALMAAAAVPALAELLR